MILWTFFDAFLKQKRTVQQAFFCFLFFCVFFPGFLERKLLSFFPCCLGFDRKQAWFLSCVLYLRDNGLDCAT